MCSCKAGIDRQRQKGTESSLVSSKNTNPIRLGPPPYDFTLNYLLKFLFPDTVTLEVRVSTYKWGAGGWTQFSPHRVPRPEVVCILYSSSPPQSPGHPSLWAAGPKFLFNPSLHSTSTVTLPAQGPSCLPGPLLVVKWLFLLCGPSTVMLLGQHPK